MSDHAHPPSDPEDPSTEVVDAGERSATRADTGSGDGPGPPRRDPRLRTVAVVVAVGVGLAVLGAAGVGVAGGSGRAGAAVLLLVLALSLAAGALVALGTALVDEIRDRPVGRARVVVGVVLFAAAAAFMAMTAGIGG